MNDGIDIFARVDRQTRKQPQLATAARMYRVLVIGRHLSPMEHQAGDASAPDLLQEAYCAMYLEGLPTSGKVRPFCPSVSPSNARTTS